MMKQKYLDEALLAYAETDMYPFHMPGHKRQFLGEMRPEQIDITEIHDFDNLHHAEGIIREGQQRLASLFGASESCYLVNGSTVGLLAAICGCTRKGDRVLVARNCHKAVYHALYLHELEPVYLWPEETFFGIQGSISPEQVRMQLGQSRGIKAVILTSPTYDGVVSDIRQISEIVHAYGIPLIVDEAHGAHFGFSGGFPPKALALGADLVIESLHKTLPSFTQTAALHFSDSPYVDRVRVKRYLGMLMTSSPSYLFMAGMDRCVRMLQEKGPELFRDYERRLDKFYEECRKLQYMKIYAPEQNKTESGLDPGVFDRDPSKILISGAQIGLDGQQLGELLRERFHLEMEMTSGHYVTALTSIMDTEEGFLRLLQALQTLDREAGDAGKNGQGACHSRKTMQSSMFRLSYRLPEQVMSIHEATDADETDLILLQDSAGCVSTEYIYLYPPGIPWIVPGERIEADILSQLLECRRRGMSLQGMEDMKGEQIRVL